MPLTPIVGDARLRALQFGIESTFNTPVAATRRMPWASTISVDPHWTFPTADTGTLSDAMAPYGTAQDLTIAVTGQQLASNDAPTVISAGLMGGLALSTSGTSKSLTAQPAETSQDVFDTYTGEWFDDATNDSWQLAGGVINDFKLTYPQDLGPIQLDANWRFGKIGAYPGTPTGGLNVDASPVWLYAADTTFYVNDTSGTIEISPLTNIAYGAEFSVNNNLDLKRFANGSNTRFTIQNYGRGKRTVNFKLTGAKGTAWLAEAVKWIAANPVERFWGIKTISLQNASTGPAVPHSLDIRFPGYWLTRADQVIGSNTAFDLNGQAIYDTNLGYSVRMVSVSTRAAL